MLIRKYVANNLKEALVLVKSDLGEDATILATRQVKTGLLRTQLEVTATLPPAQTAAPSTIFSGGTPPVHPLEINTVAKYLHPLRQEIRALHSEMKAIAREQQQQQHHQQQSSAHDEEIDNSLNELKDFLKMLQEKNLLSSEEKAPNEPNFPELRQKLTDSGMSENSVDYLVNVVASNAPADAADAKIVADNLATQIIKDNIKVVPGAEHTGPRIVALVGPAGVGKTTTLAKIAARAVFTHGQRVGLIGCDTECIGAAQAMLSMAKLLDIPCCMARTVEDIDRALDELFDCDLILVDTSGYSPRDSHAISHLAQLLKAAEAVSYLLLNADLRQLELEANLRGYAELKPQALIFTKIDLTVAFGGLWEAVGKSSLPVMYLTTGRRIPEDLEEASAERIASLIMGLQLN